jgi:release factor glutamine methyltransferase
MKSIPKIVDKAVQQLVGIAQNPQREACLLMAHVLDAPYEDIYFAVDHQINDKQEKLFNRLLQRRLKHEPLSKITEFREFWSLPFRVTADTLDPRPDSETLIEAVLALYPDRTSRLRILDLGTGTGCLLLSLLHEYPNAWGVGIDKSEAASNIAQENATRLNLKSRSVFMVGNWGDALSGSFDIILSNPPYIGRSESLPPEVGLYDPGLALYAGDDGLDCYRILANQIPNLITPKSKIFLEIGSGQQTAVTAIFAHFYLFQTIKDLQGIERCAIFGIYTATVERA